MNYCPIAFLAACSDRKGGESGNDGDINVAIIETKALKAKVESVNIEPE